jgi:hypothetical protein
MSPKELDAFTPVEPALGYTRVAESFVAGMPGVWKARVVSNTAGILVMTYQAACAELRSGQWTPPIAGLLEDLESVSLDIYSGFTDVTDASHFIYATALFDSFLSESTKFLLLLQPEKLGEDCKVSLGAVLGAKSRSDIINSEVLRRVKNLGFQPMPNRLEFLQRRFGLDPLVNPSMAEPLQDFVTQRNRLVHDLGTFALAVGENRELLLRARACPFHPAQLDIGDMWEAARLYLTVGFNLYKAVMGSVLRAEPTDDFRRVCKLFEIMEHSSVKQCAISARHAQPT